MIQPSTQQWQRDHLGPSFQREIAWLRVDHLRTTRIFAATFGPLINAMQTLATSLATATTVAIDTMNTRVGGGGGTRSTQADRDGDHRGRVR